MDTETEILAEKQVNLVKEVELIHAVISKMSNNLFPIKGWTMTLMYTIVVLGKDLIIKYPQGVYFRIITVCNIIL